MLQSAINPGPWAMTFFFYGHIAHIIYIDPGGRLGDDGEYSIHPNNACNMFGFRKKVKVLTAVI